MFIELHDTGGNITLICVEDIQRVRKGAHGGSDIFMNELEGWVQVAESVAAVRDLIIKTGDIVTASQNVAGSAKPSRLQPVDHPRAEDEQNAAHMEASGVVGVSLFSYPFEPP